MLKKYGRLIFLVILLLIVTELTIYVNNFVDDKTTVNTRSQTVEKLREALENSDTDLTDRNPYMEFWVQELEYFKTEYPKAETKRFEEIDIKRWNASIDALIKEVQTTNVDDVTLINKVKELVKEQVGMNYILDVFSDNIEEGYFRSILLLIEDDAK